MSGINTQQIKLVLKSLETTGQPPKWGASLINVGTDQFLEEIDEEFLQDHLLPIDGMDGGGACKWIEADYGNGKTQFLRCVQEMAWNHDFVTAFVELSQDECPLDRIDRIFNSIAKSIQPPPKKLVDIDRSKGLDITILELVDRKFDGAISAGIESPLLLKWVGQLVAIPVESSSIPTAAACLIRSVLSGDEKQEALARAFLRGDVIPSAELREIGVHEKLDKSSGFRLLRTVCQFLQRSGLAKGVILLFDEARRSLSLMANRAQKTACENLLSIINKCNSGDLPGTLFLYAVMPEFFTDFATNYPALQQRCSPKTRVPLNSLSTNEHDLLVEIGEKIACLFCHGFNTKFDDRTLKRNLAQLASASIRAAMGSGTRRQMVQATVGMLSQAKRDEGLTEFSSDQADACIEGVVKERTEARKQEVDDEGE
jgi:hypothetical protein